MNWYKTTQTRITGEFEDYHLNPETYLDVGHPGTPTKEVFLWILDKKDNMHYATSEYGSKSHKSAFVPFYDKAVAYGRVDPGAGKASIAINNFNIPDYCAAMEEGKCVRHIISIIKDDIQSKFDQNINFLLDRDTINRFSD